MFRSIFLRGLKLFVVQPSDRPLEIARLIMPRLSLPAPPQYHENIYRAPVPSSSTSLTSSIPSSSTRVASVSASSVESNETELDASQRIMMRLIHREGVSHYDQRDLLEQCNNCRQYFLNTFLRVHIIACSNDGDEPLQFNFRKLLREL